MRKAQFVLEDTAEGKQAGFAARRRDDLDAEGQFARFSSYWHGQDRKADQGHDESDREIVDRRLQSRPPIAVTSPISFDQGKTDAAGAIKKSVRMNSSRKLR